jgi:hypothetical protein
MVPGGRDISWATATIRPFATTTARLEYFRPAAGYPRHPQPVFKEPLT